MTSERKIIRGYGENGETYGATTEAQYTTRKAYARERFIASRPDLQPSQAATLFELDVWKDQEGFKS